MRMQKKGLAVNLMLILALVGIVAIALFAMKQLGGKAELPDIGLQVTPDKVTPVTMPCEYSPSLTFNCVDIENKGTSVTCTVHYKRDSGIISTDADGTSVTLNPYEHIEYMVNSTGWYSVHGDYTVPCEPKPTVDVFMKDYATSPVLQFYAEDDGLVISTTATEKIEAGDAPVIKFIYYGDPEDYVQDSVFFCDTDKTYSDDVTLDGSKGDSNLIPDHYVHSSSGAAGQNLLDTTEGGWSLGDIRGTVTGTKYLSFDTDDTNAAGGTMNATCYLADQGWYIDEDAGSFEYGADDENTADIDQDTFKFNVTLYTGAS